MSFRTIEKVITLRAPQKKVWEILTRDDHTRTWYAAFREGSHAVTDWKEGSKAAFLDNDDNGIVGIIETSQPFSLLSLVYTGAIKKGVEDLDGPDAIQVKGGHETYRLTEINGGTELHISLDMDSSFFDYMSKSWDKALEIIQDLAESRQEA
jgi:uncharacterized protein YndB with AHSA1/START domain